MKTHLKTLGLLAAMISFFVCAKYFPLITFVAVIIVSMYALLYDAVQKTEQRKKDHEDDKK